MSAKESKSKAQKIVAHLKRELLIDLNISKDTIRNYELAARRLETILQDPTKVN